MPTREPVVLYGVEEGVARITLNRPDRLNASNGELSAALTAAFARAGADPGAKVVLLMGAGRGFCAGADLRILDQLSNDPEAPNSGSGGLRYDGLMLFDKPVIAAIHGACAGIGLALACAADIRIAATNALFVSPFAQLGLCAEGGLAWLLPRLVGRGNAAEILLSGRRVVADEAYAKGLVSRVLDAEGFVEAAFAYAAGVARGSPASFAQIKRQLHEADGQAFAQARELAADLAQSTMRASDFKEAVAARREARDPRFADRPAKFAPPVADV